MGLKGRLSSCNSKSYQYLPRTYRPLSPYLSSSACMPVKIFEKVSPRLKLRRPSSEMADCPVPPLLAPISLLSALAVDQLAPMDSSVSICPSTGPTLKLTPQADVDARLTASASLARRQDRWTEDIDTSPWAHCNKPARMKQIQILTRTRPSPRSCCRTQPSFLGSCYGTEVYQCISVNASFTPNATSTAPMVRSNQ